MAGGRKPQKVVRVTVYLPPEMVALIEAVRSKQGRGSTSEMIRWALDRYLDGYRNGGNGKDPQKRDK